MAEENRITQVVAALLWRGPRFLICQRPEGKKRGLLWECSGGKIEPGESGEEALARECREELGVEVAVGGVFTSVTHAYPDMTVRLTLYHASLKRGEEPRLLEHRALAWITVGEADGYAFCPADIPILERLKKAVGTVKTLAVGRAEAAVFLPDTTRAAGADTVVYLHEPFSAALAVKTALSPSQRPPVLVSIDGIDWDADLSPWPAEAVFRGSPGFSGGAGAYLAFFRGELIPAVEAELAAPPRLRVIAGYSLAGLFAVWASLECGLFGACVSASGSLWYDGFTAYVREHARPGTFYLSLGDREKNARNPRMARVEEATGETARLLAAAGARVRYELNPGGHFRDPDKRLARGIDAILY